MRTPFIAGNWKMYKTVAETVHFVKELRGLVKNIERVEIVLAPPFTAVHAAAGAARNSSVAIAAQDMHWEDEGAFTGAISASMIREAGAEYVVIGHSERRTLFGETDATVNRKVVAAVAAELVPNHVRGRDTRSARSERDVGGARPAGPRGPRRGWRRTKSVT